MKRCGRCHETKPSEQFSRCKSEGDGLTCYCKPCLSVTSREYRLKHKEQIAANNALWRAKNADRKRATSKLHYAANKPAYIARAKVWLAEHPEGRRQLVRKRRALAAGAGSTVTARQVREVFESFGHRCAYCLRYDATKLSVDHVLAISKGGHDVIENIVPACMPCNLDKNARGVLYMLNRCASASI